MTLFCPVLDVVAPRGEMGETSLPQHDLQSSTTAGASLNPWIGRESSWVPRMTLGFALGNYRDGSFTGHVGEATGSAVSGEAGIPPCPQQINGLTKCISPRKCHLIIHSILYPICSANGRRGHVTSACACSLKALPAYEHHIFYFKVTEE